MIGAPKTGASAARDAVWERTAPKANGGGLTGGNLGVEDVVSMK